MRVRRKVKRIKYEAARGEKSNKPKKAFKNFTIAEIEDITEIEKEDILKLKDDN